MTIIDYYLFLAASFKQVFLYNAVWFQCDFFLFQIIVFPVFGVVINVMRNLLKCCLISDNVVVKQRLPGEIGMNFTNFKGTTPFVPSYDSWNVFMKHWIFITGKTANGFVGFISVIHVIHVIHVIPRRDAINRVSTGDNVDNVYNVDNGNKPNKSIGGFAGDKNPMFHENISRIIRWYKGRCTFEIRKIHTDFAWQSLFYDHIIRNETAFQKITHYINNNPKNWENDNLK